MLKCIGKFGERNFALSDGCVFTHELLRLSVSGFLLRYPTVAYPRQPQAIAKPRHLMPGAFRPGIRFDHKHQLQQLPRQYR